MFNFKNTGEKILDKFFPLPGNNNLKTSEGTIIKSANLINCFRAIWKKIKKESFFTFYLLFFIIVQFNMEIKKHQFLKIFSY